MKEEVLKNKIMLKCREYNYEITFKKIKNIYLRVNNNNIYISAPKKAKVSNIEKFILEKSDWIEKTIIKQNMLKDVNVKKESLYEEDEFFKIIKEYVNLYSNKLKLYPNKVSIKKMKYAWGSCTSKKNISFNYELIYKDKSLIEYVVVHELVHLKYMNHQKEFWKLVEENIPDFKIKRKILKDM